MAAVSREVLRQAALCVTAQQRIKQWLVTTPCLKARQAFDDNSDLYFKAENFQHTGSFKYRGALARLTSLSTDTPVITASSGNHGLALATAATITGHRLSVVLPETVALEKLNRIKALGVDTLLYSEDAGLAEQHAQALARDYGYQYVSPYDDEIVVAGQGTIALELLLQVSRIDSVFISMGGGGLISGIGSVLKTYSPRTRIVGVSAANSAALAASMLAGEVVEVDHCPTLADGCAGSVAEGAMTLPLATAVVDDIVECTEREIAEAMQALAWEEKMLVEGAAGLAFAAFRKSARELRGITSVVILCGANFDRDTVASIIAPGSDAAPASF